MRKQENDTATNDHSHKRQNKQSTKPNDTKKDERLQEFLQVMQPRIKSKAWANEDGRIVDARPGAVQQQKKKTTNVIEVPNRKPGGNGMMVKKMHTKFDDGSDNEEGNGHNTVNNNAVSVHEDDDASDAMMMLPAQDSVAHNTSVSNLDYLRSKMVLQTDLEMVRNRVKH
jgi:multiple RNA-binding domain-containing protein 1